MPDFDSGHIFLTTFAPIRDSGSGGHKHTSFTQDVRIALAKLPTALQSPATEKIGVNSPFARNTRTHLARMFVLNDVVYNGRVGKNALAASVTGDDPATIQEVDRLNTSYLVFCADIDAVEQDGAPLPTELTPEAQKRVRASYARKLWDTMEDELRDVYVNCVGFDGVETGDDFAAYLERCHVETTMPFHDYYLKMPTFNRLPVKGLLIGVGIPLVFTLLALLLRVMGVGEMPVIGMNTLLALILGAIVTGGALYGAVRYAISNGEKPLPPGEYDDLPSVLKALYMQRRFSDFVVDTQGASDADLHKAFGAFVDQHKPGDRSGPTQGPGVIGAP
ncbi:hypothetical protein [uncultured Tateyamaria sp.]|uniref:hypothetical protein n=1 Tax=uncultured Tateyamaria sp. TaxID=455651 RepID=UPI002620EC9B|nr:hypothetical protein [uncultured Tateyamaria sp.]